MATEELALPAAEPERVQWQGPLPPVHRRLRQKTMVRENEEMDEPVAWTSGDIELGDHPHEEPLLQEAVHEDDRHVM